MSGVRKPWAVCRWQRRRPYPSPYLTTKTNSMPKFFSKFSKKLKHRLAGDGPKPGGSGTDVATVSVDSENKVDGDEGKIDLMGLPLLPRNPEVAPDGGRKPEVGMDVNKGEVGSMDLSLQLGGGVPGSGRRREGNEAVVEGEVGPVNPPSRSDLGISQGDQGPSGGT